MCGIAGLLYFDHGRSVSPEVVRGMTTCLAHRGPDDDGVYVDGNVGLGHRRLSIIDLAGGHQPMSSGESDCHIVFNGEIYNYLDVNRELASRGHRFDTRSDTETILRAYEEYGDRCVEHLNGMFAFALWDRRRRRLLLGRDRLGKKPLYVLHDGTQLAFASELKSLVQLAGVAPEIDPYAVDSYFSYNYVPEPASIYRGIRRLPPAHTLSVTGREVAERRYWAIPDPAPRPEADEGALAEELHALLTDAVRIRMISDVPIGVFLSGGVDSSAITGLMAGLSPTPIKTFSIRGGAGVFDELPYARAVARQYGTDHHEYDVGEEPLDALLPKLLRHFDEPFADSSMIPTYHVSRIAREQVTVALSGEGGDELFAGYTWHRKFAIVRQQWRLIPAPLRRLIAAGGLPDASVPAVQRNAVARALQKVSLANSFSFGEDAPSYESFTTSYTPGFKSLVYGDVMKEAIAAGGTDDYRAIGAAEVFARSPGSLLSRILATDMQVYLPGDLLTKVDRMSMASSLEVRSPLLDYRLVEWSRTVPDRLKLRGGVSKYILRRAMDRVLPTEVKERKTKRGFSVPVSDWLRGPMQEYARRVLLDESFLRQGFFDRAGVSRALDDHQRGAREYGPQLWALLSFAIWAGQRDSRAG